MFLHGSSSGSGFQISLDPDPVSVPPGSSSTSTTSLPFRARIVSANASAFKFSSRILSLKIKKVSFLLKVRKFLDKTKAKPIRNHADVTGKNLGCDEDAKELSSALGYRDNHASNNTFFQHFTIPRPISSTDHLPTKVEI